MSRRDGATSADHRSFSSTEDLFDLLAFALADVVPGMSGRAAVDRAAPAGGDVLRDVGRDLHVAQFGDEARIIVPLVGAECDVTARDVAEHYQRRIALAKPIGGRHAGRD